MLFDCISDLHLDHYDELFDLRDIQKSENLIIAGDIADDLSIVNSFIINARSHYKNVIFVDGNHEFRGTGSFMETRKELTELTNISNIHYLDGGFTIIVDGTTKVVVMGANCWYDWNILWPHVPADKAKSSWAKRSKDAHINFSPYPSPDFIGQNSIKRLISKLEVISKYVDTEIIMVTHTSPMKHKAVVRNDEYWDVMTPSYYNSKLADLLASDVNNQIKNWVFGHSHFHVDEEHNGIRYINNSRGYPHENNGNYQVVQIEV